LKSLKRRFYRWFHLFADYIVANSNENLRIIRKINPLLSSEKCYVIYNLIDFDYWKSSEDYNLCEDGKIHILVAASHQYMKNAKGLIEAVDSLKDNEKQRIKIDWYGDERSDDSLQNALIMIRKRKLENIFSFRKATSDIRSKMQHADVVGLFSFYEGLPNVVCEAMVVGKPIISSSVSDIPIILDHDINCIFDPHDSKDISKTISYILSLSSNELLNLGKLNKLKGCRLFDKNKSLSSYLSLLRR
jgi:glycosyltransferase involved in cell wall biosynthesis